MARRDGSGPLGCGSMTGRGLGVCKGEKGMRRGASLGAGKGFGQRRGLGRNIEFEQENTNTHKEFLNQQKQILEDKLGLIKEELQNL